MQTIGAEVVAVQTIIEESFAGHSQFVHALPGERGRIVEVDEDGVPTVLFDRTGTATIVDDREITATRHVIPTWFTIAEACKILKLSRATLYRRAEEGKIKLVKDGAHTFVSGAELARYRN